MRRIISQEEENKKRRRNQLIIGGILILVMIASTLGYAFTRDQQTTNSQQIIYNEYQFTQTSTFWDVNIGSYLFSFKYNPTQTQKINSIINPLANYAGKPLYIYSEDNAATSEIYRNLFYQNQIVQRMQNACPEGTNCSDNSPVKTCDNNFIIIRESNSTGITQSNNCVYIQGKSENLTSLSDTFLFKITGIQ